MAAWVDLKRFLFRYQKNFITGRSSQVPVLTETLGCAQQVVCGQNCTFIVTANGSVLACGEGSYGRLGQGNSDDLHTPTVISTLQGTVMLFYILFLSAIEK